MVWKFLTFVLPLGLDSFAVAAALGTQPPNRAQLWRISALFVVFEAGMPLVGLALGAPLAHLIGAAAEYVAAAALIVVGVWMLFFGDDEHEEELAGRLLSTRGLAAIALGLSISVGQASADLDPITAALVAAVQARRASRADTAVLDALRQAADHCRIRLQERLAQALAEAEQAQQRFAAAQTGNDETEKVRRYADGEAAMRQAEAVAQQVEQALLDLSAGIIELTGPALERLQRGVHATQRLVETVEAQS